MIPEDYKMPVKSGGNFEPLPEDTYQVQIAKIELKKDQKAYKSEELIDKLAFTFVIVEPGKWFKRILWKDCRIIVNPAFEGGSASWLYKIFSAVNNVKLTKEEASSVSIKDINAMEGRQLRLTVKQKVGNDGEIRNTVEDTLPIKELITVDLTTKKPEPAQTTESDFERGLREDAERLNAEETPAQVADEDDLPPF